MKAPLVGILTHNRCQLLQECIQSLDDTKEDIVIAVADDASTDGTKEWLLNEAQVDIVIPSEVQGGVAINSNRLISLAKEEKAEVLFLINDDILVKPGVFDLYLKAIKNSGYQHFCFTDPKSQYLAYNEFDRGGVTLVERRRGDGVFLTITQEMIKTLGGFETDYGLFGVEHCSYSRRAAAAGFARNVLDVKGSENFIKTRQYYEDIPVAVKNKFVHMQEAMKKYYTDWALPPVIFHPIVTE